MSDMPIRRIGIRSATVGRERTYYGSTFVTEVPDATAPLVSGSRSQSEPAPLPGCLEGIIVEDRNSLLYRVIAGEAVGDLSRQALARLWVDVRRYQARCMDEGLIAESQYLQDVIDRLRAPRVPRERVAIDEVEERLARAKELLERKRRQFAVRREQLRIEEDVAEYEISMRFQEAVSRCEAQWSSERAMKRFNKPSPDLIQLRRQARSLLSTGRFDEAAAMASEIAEVENRETLEAALRMQRAFDGAQQRVRCTYEAEGGASRQNYDLRMRALGRDEEAAVLPVERRVEKYESMMEAAIQRLKRWQREARDQAATRRARDRPVAPSKPIVLDAKLKLPPLATATARAARLTLRREP